MVGIVSSVVVVVVAWVSCPIYPQDDIETISIAAIAATNAFIIFSSLKYIGQARKSEPVL
jgi:hypothetical protein